MSKSYPYHHETDNETHYAVVAEKEDLHNVKRYQCPKCDAVGHIWRKRPSSGLYICHSCDSGFNEKTLNQFQTLED